MGEKLTIIVAMLAIMVMMPYFITMAINGKRENNKLSIDNVNTGREVLISINGKNELIDVERYIVGVLPGIAGPENNDEMLAAQAVAVRTEIYYKMENETVIREDNLTYEYYTKEKYIENWGKKSYSKDMPRYENAVMSTIGKIIE
ncbi:MAG: hypothetical protein IJT72_09315 [Lachnospiraceae bacterium]|nr:hypothetical protein [Lachnospiraceae bacterium]